MNGQPEAIISSYSEAEIGIFTNVVYMKIPEISLFVPVLLNRTDLYIPLLLSNYLLRNEKLFLFMATHA